MSEGSSLSKWAFLGACLSLLQRGLGGLAGQGRVPGAASRPSMGATFTPLSLAGTLVADGFSC